MSDAENHYDCEDSCSCSSSCSCNSCISSCSSDDDCNSNNESTETPDFKNADDVFIDIVRTRATQNKCILCKRKRSTKSGKKFKRISDQSVIDAYIKTSILIPFGSRGCTHHFDSFGFLNKNSLGKQDKL